MKIQFHRIDTNVVVGLLVREFCCSGTDVSAKVLAMYACTRTPSMEPQWLAAGLSQHDYANQDNSFIDIERIFDLFQNYEECMNYLHTLSDKMCMELQAFDIYGISDEDAMEIIQKKTDCKSPADFQRLGLLKRNQYLKELKDSGISVRQLNRLTGISRGAINAAINQS